MELYEKPARKPVPNATLERLAGRQGSFLQRAAAVGALILAILGFDADLLMLSRVAHMSEAVMGVIQHVV